MRKMWLFVLLSVLVAASMVLTSWLLLFDGLATVTDALLSAATTLVNLSQVARLWWLCAFALLSFALQLLVVPSGSLLLIGAGFVFGVTPSVVIFTLMQCAAIWPIYFICRAGTRATYNTDIHGDASADTRVNVSSRTQRSWLPRFRAEWLSHTPAAEVIRSEPVVSSMVLRLTPILPSAGASTIAALSGIALRTFLLATVLVGWIRPLFFAGIGATVNEVSGLASAVSGDVNPTPLLLVFAAVAGLFLMRLWFRLRRKSVADV